MTTPFLLAIGLSMLSVTATLTAIFKSSNPNGRVVVIMMIFGVILPLMVLASPMSAEWKIPFIAGGISMCALIRPLLTKDG